MKLVARVPVSDLPVGATRQLLYEPFHVLLVNLAGVPYAIEDTCNHAGALLSDGELRGPIVSCPAHGYLFDVRTGALIAPLGLCPPQRTFDVLREADEYAIYDSFPSPLVVGG